MPASNVFDIPHNETLAVSLYVPQLSDKQSFRALRRMHAPTQTPMRNLMRLAAILHGH